MGHPAELGLPSGFRGFVGMEFWLCVAGGLNCLRRRLWGWFHRQECPRDIKKLQEKPGAQAPGFLPDLELEALRQTQLVGVGSIADGDRIGSIHV